MKKLIRNTIIALAAPALMLISCHESFDELNTDPTHMSQANAGSFVKPIMYGMATYNWNRYNSWTFQLMQLCVSTSSTSGIGWYNATDASGDGSWTNYYYYLTNAKAMYKYGEQAEDNNYKAVSLTLQGWIFELLTDAFGDIPFEDACKGEEGVYQPRFDKQQDVYANIIDMLDDANNLYDTSKGLQFNSSGDMLYCTSDADTEGIALWKKFANSLRMRALLRVIDVPGLDAANKLKEMVDNPEKYPVFESNDESAMVSVSGVAPEEAPLARPSDFTSYLVLSEFFINTLKEWNDPRLPIFARTATNDGVTGYYGMQSGYQVLPSISASLPNTDNLAVAPMKLQLMTYPEVLFIKAELAQRGVISADAKGLYEQAVTAAIEQWGATVPADYFDNPATAYDGTLQRIMEQKFYALFFCDYQQWFEYNRTGYPDVPVGPGVDSTKKMLTRFKYPSILQRTNKANYDAAKESMGGDDFYIKLIWQK